MLVAVIPDGTPEISLLNHALDELTLVNQHCFYARIPGIICARVQQKDYC